MKNFILDNIFVDVNSDRSSFIIGYEEQRLVLPIHKLFSLWLLVKEFCIYADKKRLLITKYKEKISIDNIK